ncbi:MAG: PDZ domain-containing protein [Clostridia bacterium]|nr:PDZ domain-containing protein [Clostridia bacterium]
MNKHRITLSTAIAIALLAVVTASIIVFFATVELCKKDLVDPRQYGSLFFKLNAIHNIVDTYYVGEYDEQELFESMFAGYIDGLGDKWSGYYTEEQTNQIMDINSNTYVGIGVTFTQNEQGQYEITGLNPKGPAFQAGISVRDIIHKVNDTPASQLETTDDVVAAVKGE